MSRPARHQAVRGEPFIKAPWGQIVWHGISSLSAIRHICLFTANTGLALRPQEDVVVVIQNTVDYMIAMKLAVLKCATSRPVSSWFIPDCRVSVAFAGSK